MLARLLFTVLGSFSFIQLSLADTGKLPERVKQIVCAHHQLCNLTLKLLDLNEHHKVRAAFVNENSDHHETALAPELLKIYYEAPYLILPDLALGPWLPSVLKNRKPTDTFVAQVSSESITGSYPGALAHFWLYEREFCALNLELATKLEAWDFKLRENAQKCASARFKILMKKLKMRLKGQMVILTHNALAPLLESLGARFIILKSGAHAHEISPDVFKEVHHLLAKHEKLLWIVESEIGIPPQLSNLIRETDQQVVIKVSGHYGDSTFGPLEELNAKLGAHQDRENE